MLNLVTRFDLNIETLFARRTQLLPVNFWLKKGCHKKEMAFHGIYVYNINMFSRARRVSDYYNPS